MKIRIDKPGLKKIANQLKTNAKNLHSEGEKINTIINELSEYWQGEDKDRCVSVTKDTYLVNLEKEKSRIESYAAYLEQVPKLYDDLDNKFIARKIS